MERSESRGVAVEVVGIPGSREFDTKEEAIEYAIERVQEGWVTHWYTTPKRPNTYTGFGHSKETFTVSWWCQ